MKPSYNNIICLKFNERKPLCICIEIKALVLTWEEHGGHHLWLFQGVDNAALEGLADGRLQVAERKEEGLPTYAA